LSADAPGNIEPVEQRKEALKKKFAEFGKPLSDMIESIENPKDIFRDDLRWVDLKDWYKNRVVLLGDAKHAISPMMGMGASLALEDAYVLFDELSKISSPKAIDSALNNFAIRRDRRLKFIRKSAKRIEGWIMAKGFKAWIRELVGPFIPTSIFINDLKKIVNEKI
jgi:2-polyprenyl-6-methoxyphenol hydroxylase-like FAD-dependent oxidoreductase